MLRRGAIKALLMDNASWQVAGWGGCTVGVVGEVEFI